ncbi:dihydroxyacetone kinase subunit DhaL [Enterococcus avium]|uniref:phosphoenolpyruvate--glycerone phosphotransferase n=1 Tax=Enterococcus avium TaxID=33945 RepID=A0ABD5F7G9_ENTAV|nr:dihydroxyacetone kinase subunit DhaL [Enterococcus avium]MDT2397789.1 dihydroxyacetone kinase subunit DhaL [Enterococcus avium]MDT2435718.1 dihydroxyacetone kinase subunit DhaL [Enterococcus avium]MDT2448634.1 dihydroxyacetone kinase subunit DhaL [Enterococcus avium]MDT2466159.1 dihydroxyacetone kinase subunit DhaL [Enterococcus avium]MDT2469869.1 dihydroxyacetone kinase subunit DhaL [Enterococcus avium]
MKQSFTNEAGLTVVIKVIETIKSNREYLSEVDSVGGDGDHGINMNKGFTMAEKEIEGQAQVNMSEGFKIISGVLVNKIGGSMGPLYGSFFRGLSVASKKEVEINKEVFGAMLEKAYQNIAMLTEAKIGDKTLMDVLIPAVETYRAQVTASSFADCLEEMLKAAEAGLESTKQMTAKVGRASRIGDRSLGHQDAGATSCYLMLKALAEGIKELL